MTRQQVLDLYFVEARSKLIDVAAFLDRAQRAKGADDFRLNSFRTALGQLRSGNPDRDSRVPACLSDPQSVIRNPPWAEARIHFHIPLHPPPTDWFDTTSGHLLGVLDVLQFNPNLCSHLEMETYSWDVLPPELKSRSVVDQLTAEYEWRQRGLA